ncbi:phage tail tape measure protein [Laribacter hongkongensis]|uniref:phage tail tape measure protein n=1 Tax=Laribacter hongkongensis TaxID=168471 RepID=UPI001EFCF45A|nr:phage tail tape measure protein [Laribacter hongkongensis]MCG9057576.1 phage tail tape measure protein [Laribacter hongkongensis]MCG9085970.1 phage tail tape measure protein [Laribacter hongkongensis]
MSKNLAVSITIGAQASSALAAFGSVKQSLEGIGKTTNLLKVKQNELGNAIQRHMGTLAPQTLAAMNREYVKLGQTIDQLQAKQARLNRLQTQGESLRNARADLRGQAMEIIGTTAALAVPVVQSVRLAAGFQDQMRDIAITGEFSKAEEAKLGGTIRDAAVKWNQTQAEVARGTNVLVAGGIQNAKALETYAPIMAKAATATRASMDDLGSVAIALKDNLKIGEEGFEGALNMLAYAGKRGQFEIRDMAKWLPNLTPMFGDLGVTGKEAVAEIAAALQIARKGAGSNDEAANNFRNFMQKLTAPETLKDFEKANIDLKTSMTLLRGQGFTPMEAMLKTINQYLSTKSPQAADQFMKAMNLKDDKERQSALEKLSSAYKLGELFQDMQAMSFIRPAIANMGEMQDIKKGSMDATNKGLIDQDWKKRMDTASSQFDKFKIGMMELGMTIGDALLPTITDTITAVMPAVKAFGAWAKENPGLIKGAIGLAAGLAATKLGFIGLKYAVNLGVSPFHSMATAWAVLSSRVTIARALLAGGLPRLPLLLQFFGMGASRADKLAGTLVKLGTGLGSFGSKALALGRVLGGSLVRNGMAVGRTLLWLGRAMLMNPIGLAVTAIAGGAYLIYRNWDKIKPWFRGLWAEVKAAFAGGLGGIAKLVLNWSPLGLFYKAFAGVMKWFGVNLPKNFSDFGGMLIGGLVNGIKAKLGAARDTIVNFGSSIKGWFTSTLGIKSPSRVFMGFGDNIAQGTAIGIGRSATQASKAAGSMAQATLKAASQASAPNGAGNVGGGVVVHLTQTFHIEGGKDIKGQIQQATQLTVRELEKMMERVVASQRRRAYS